jgi:uncharacterized protein (DUF2147 family)
MRRKFPATFRLSYGQHGCWLCTILLFSVALCGLVTPAFAATPVGLWYAEGGAAQVEISACGDALCGRIVWLRSPLDETGCDLRDRSNGNTSLRDRPLLGLEVLQGLKPADAEGKVWTDGTIYDPTSGKTYRCSGSVVDLDFCLTVCHVESSPTVRKQWFTSSWRVLTVKAIRW